MEAPQRAGATLESGDGSLGFDAGFRLPVSLPGDDIMKAESSIADLLRFQGLGAEPDIPTSSFSCAPFSQRRKVISMTASPVASQRSEEPAASLSSPPSSPSPPNFSFASSFGFSFSFIFPTIPSVISPSTHNRQHHRLWCSLSCICYVVAIVNSI